jgi:tRNA-binding protein
MTDEIDHATPVASFDDFLKIDIRVGTVIEANPFPEARKPAIKLVIDFGDKLGTRRSSAQITELYDPGSLVGKRVMAVVNFPPRQIGPFMSEVLTLGVANDKGKIVLIGPDGDAPNGSRMY